MIDWIYWKKRNRLNVYQFMKNNGAKTYEDLCKVLNSRQVASPDSDPDVDFAVAKIEREFQASQAATAAKPRGTRKAIRQKLGVNSSKKTQPSKQKAKKPAAVPPSKGASGERS